MVRIILRDVGWIPSSTSICSRAVLGAQQGDAIGAENKESFNDTASNNKETVSKIINTDIGKIKI